MQQKQLVRMSLITGLADEVSHLVRQKTLEEEQPGFFLLPQHLNRQTSLCALLKPTKSCQVPVLEISEKLPTPKTEANKLRFLIHLMTCDYVFIHVNKRYSVESEGQKVA